MLQKLFLLFFVPERFSFRSKSKGFAFTKKLLIFLQSVFDWKVMEHKRKILIPDDEPVKQTKKEKQTEKLIIYTDGSCLKNPGNGGWAYLIKHFYEDDFEDESEKKPFLEKNGSGSEKDTTNNRMELKAVIECLKFLKNNKCENITINVDSKYVMDGITDWIYSWKKNNWKKSTGGSVLNKDLWLELDSLVSEKRDFIQWKWVKGHSGQKENDIVDKLASKAAKSL